MRMLTCARIPNGLEVHQSFQNYLHLLFSCDAKQKLNIQRNHDTVP